MAAFFGVSLFYLRGESNDRTRQEDWMSEGYSGADEEPVYRPAPAPKKMKAEARPGGHHAGRCSGADRPGSSSAPVVLEVLRSLRAGSGRPGRLERAGQAEISL